MITFAVTLTAFIVCTSSGVDRQVTLHLSAAAYTIIGIASVIVAGLTAKGYVSESSSQTGLIALSTLRRDTPVKWRVQGILLVTFAAVLSAVASWYFLTVLVAYLPGESHRSTGVIERFYTVGARGRLCNTYGIVAIESGGRERFCYERGVFVRRRIGSETLNAGEHVVIVTTYTAMGSAIQSVTPASR